MVKGCSVSSILPPAFGEVASYPIVSVRAFAILRCVSTGTLWRSMVVSGWLGAF